MVSHTPDTDKEQDLSPFKRALAVTARAMAANNKVDVVFIEDSSEAAGEAVTFSADTITILSPHEKMSMQQVAVMRGKSDAQSLKLAWHNSEMHQHLLPDSPIGAAVFEAIEQTRVESIGANLMPGVMRNLAAKVKASYRKDQFADVDARVIIHLPDALAAMMRQKLTGQKPPKALNPVMDVWTPWIEEKGGENLDNLVANLHDQKAFGQTLQKILQDLDVMDSEKRGDETEDEDNKQQGQEDEEENGNNEQEDDQSGDSDSGDGGGEADQQGESNEDSQLDKDGDYTDANYEMQDDGLTPQKDQEVWHQNVDVLNVPEAFGYNIYTTKHDEVIGAEKLASSVELERLRSMLDKQLDGFASIVSRMANKLQRKLLAQQNRTWNFDLEEGLLDTARLTRVITDPFQALSFKMEQEMEFRDTVVTLLIDNSGSMRGRPIMVAACTADILTRTLERCGVKTEILGFTTKNWKGGSSREDWMKDGMPPLPGRLNDLRHIVFKSADMPWRRSRKNLGLMMREGMLKENIDGEALTWAYQRLVGRPEHRKIIMVISDGLPVDDGTTQANDAYFLENHLRQVIDEIETRSSVELLAIGIGHDVNRFYRRAVMINNVEDLASVMTAQLCDLFDQEVCKREERRNRLGCGF